MNTHKPNVSRRAAIVTVGALAIAVGSYVAAAAVGGAPGKRTHESVVAALRANLAHDVTAKAAYLRSHAVPPLPNAGQPPHSQLVTGIIDTGQAPFSRGRYTIENRWQELRGANLVEVYAGSAADDPGQGVVVLKLVAWPADQDVATREFKTLARDGSLRIVAAKGDALTLAAGDGRRFSFDVVAGTLAQQ